MILKPGTQTTAPAAARCEAQVGTSECRVTPEGNAQIEHAREHELSGQMLKDAITGA